ncbi:hypothetical protein [Flexithrix dorotheae]|uniref:hypothetical protein n=1 Tax=Flexithrix dorotheae TaxID=70993 RepID=UPI00037EF77E|nr:hypothetical protein [Flexithrix dorotheae]
MTRILKHLVFPALGLLLFGCGSKIEIYEWVRLDYYSINANSRDTLFGDESVHYEDYAMLVQLNPINFTTVSSSDWVQASEGFQAKNRIVKLEVITKTDYNKAKPSGKLLNDILVASFIEEGDNPENRVFLDDFVSEFGKKSNRIEEGFEIYFREGGGFAAPCTGYLDPEDPDNEDNQKDYENCMSDSKQFEIFIQLSNGTKFSGTTFRINLENE